MSTHDDILKARDYDSLWVYRTEKLCSLIVVAHGESHVYSDSKGKTRKFRHAWQIKEWLRQKYEIEIKDLEVRSFR